MLLLLSLVTCLLIRGGQHALAFPQATVTDTPGAAPSKAPILTLATVSSPKHASPELEDLTRLLPNVIENAVAVSSKSWELGALTQALLEVYDPQFAPFEWNAEALKDRPLDASWQFLAVTNGSLAGYDWTGSPGDVGGWYDKEKEKRGEKYAWLDEYLDADSAKGQTTILRTLSDGAGSLGDPCAVGPAVWLVSYLVSCRDEVKRAGLRDAQDYAWAVGNQLKYLNNGVKSENGTISMREEETFVAWSDMGYMIPPFLAFLGLATDDSGLLGYALDQWRLESSSLLRTPHDMYAHITGINPAHSWDTKIWATGNGWMTYGLVRVLASVKSSGRQDEFASQVESLHDTAVSVFDALFNELNHESILPNFMKLDVANETHSTGESAGTALTVAAFYRFAVLAPNRVTQDQVGKAEQGFNGVMGKLNKEDGWLTQVVDPSGAHDFNVVPDVKSGEAQSFVAMMWAARVAYENGKSDAPA